ncbi:MAG: antibiotic biosynthesis monooxygenase [Treponema sp.]|nr:antibiotic biosynthesis monooxygenase [Treponema sp.]
MFKALQEEPKNAIKKEGINSASRAESGNFKYDYYFPAEENDELLLIEKWKDSNAVTEYAKQPHYKRLCELKNCYVQETIIERFETNAPKN